MKNQINVPKEIQAVFAEADVCTKLAKLYASQWRFSPKAMYYTRRAIGYNKVAWNTLFSQNPDCTPADTWSYLPLTGIAVNLSAPPEVKVKIPRKPRTPKAVLQAVPTATSLKGAA